jgi:hypothetical protein
MVVFRNVVSVEVVAEIGESDGVLGRRQSGGWRRHLDEDGVVLGAGDEGSGLAEHQPVVLHRAPGRPDIEPVSRGSKTGLALERVSIENNE